MGTYATGLINASTYDSIRCKLYKEKRRLTMFSSKKFRDPAKVALGILQEVAPLPKLDPAWAYQITIKGEYEGTTQDETEAESFRASGARIKRVPSLYGGRRDVPSDLHWQAMRASEALHNAESIMRQA